MSTLEAESEEEPANDDEKGVSVLMKLLFLQDVELKLLRMLEAPKI